MANPIVQLLEFMDKPRLAGRDALTSEGGDPYDKLLEQIQSYYDQVPDPALPVGHIDPNDPGTLDPISQAINLVMRKRVGAVTGSGQRAV